jgi:2-deoxy-D-gluconate 3-dehydrogenase
MNPGIEKFSMDYFRLDGKVAMITGGNTNLGLGYTVALARAGADIFLPHFEEDVTVVKQAVEAAGRRISFLRGDLTDPAYRKALVEKCIETYGRLDILVNNAGMPGGGDLEDCLDETYLKVINLQLNVSYFMCREVGLKMRALGNGGKIINIGSALSFTGDSHGMPYPIAKHGVIGLTRSMAAAYLNDEIQVNAICPGFFHSPMNAGVPKEAAESIGRRLKGGDWGDYAELMGTAVFLASRASSYVTGTSIIVDGGFAANYL